MQNNTGHMHMEPKRYEIAEVFGMIGEANLLLQDDHLKRTQNIVVDGFMVYPISLRYMTFYQKGVTCVCCGNINHADYFSPVLPNGKINPMTHLPDRTVYTRKVWLRITNFVPMVKILNASQIAQKVWPMVREYHGWPSYEHNMGWERFLEAVAKAAANYIADNKTNILSG